MATGTVPFFHDRKGYGFVETDDSDDDVFFHVEDVGGPDLEEGQEVEFEITPGQKGPRATNFSRLQARPTMWGRTARSGRASPAHSAAASVARAGQRGGSGRGTYSWNSTGRRRRRPRRRRR